MHQKDLIRDDDNESIYYTSRSEFNDKNDRYKKTQQNNNIDTKPLNVFNYLKSSSQKAENLMDEIKDADDDIDDGKLLFIGSNKEKFNFSTFIKPLIFISAIYKGEISLKEAEFKQRNLTINQKMKKKKKKCMQANDLLEYRNKIIDAFKDGTFFSEYLKKSDEAGYNYVLKDVKNFIQEIKSMEEKIDLSLFKNVFESQSPADYAQMIINTSSDKNKKIVAEIEDRISDLKERIKKMSETEKKC